MNDYLSQAAKVLNDPEQTSGAKSIATDVLRNAGFTDADIFQFMHSEHENPMDDYMVFLA